MGEEEEHGAGGVGRGEEEENVEHRTLNVEGRREEKEEGRGEKGEEKPTAPNAAPAATPVLPLSSELARDYPVSLIRGEAASPVPCAAQQQPCAAPATPLRGEAAPPPIWLFEPGDFAKNACCNLRIQDAMSG